jgi:hypothetical protein
MVKDSPHVLCTVVYNEATQDFPQSFLLADFWSALAEMITKLEQNHFAAVSAGLHFPQKWRSEEQSLQRSKIPKF